MSVQVLYGLSLQLLGAWDFLDSFFQLPLFSFLSRPFSREANTKKGDGRGGNEGEVSDKLMGDTCRRDREEEHKSGAMAGVLRATGELAAGWDPRCLLPSRPQRTGGWVGLGFFLSQLLLCAVSVYLLNLRSVHPFMSLWVIFFLKSTCYVLFCQILFLLIFSVDMF